MVFKCINKFDGGNGAQADVMRLTIGEDGNNFVRRIKLQAGSF